MKIKELEADAKKELTVEQNEHIKKSIKSRLKKIDELETTLAVLKEDYEKFLVKDSSEIKYPQNSQRY
jgi:hypothetical protein